MNEIWTSGITGHCLEIRRSALPGMYAVGKMGRSYPVHEIYMSVCPPMPRPLLRFQKVPSIAQKNGLKRIGVFVDVRPGDYFSDAVAWAVKHGITAGVGGNKFAPNDPCTRGQIVTMLWALAGKPEPVDYKPFRMSPLRPITPRQHSGLVPAVSLPVWVIISSPLMIPALVVKS